MMCPSCCVLAVNMRGKGKVGMEDFELLKVLGTGGQYTTTSSVFIIIYNTAATFFKCVLHVTVCCCGLVLCLCVTGSGCNV